MRKKYFIIVFVMILLGLILPKGIVMLKQFTNKSQITINKVNSIKKEYSNEIDNFKREKIFPKYIQDILDKMLLFT